MVKFGQHFVDGARVIRLVQWLEVLEPLTQLHFPDVVEAAVAHGTHQVGLCLVARHLVLIFQQAGKHVLDHVLGLGIIVQQGSGQMYHLAVMLPEQALKYALVIHVSVFVL